MTHAPLKSRLNRGELILLDGAFGTELARRGIPTPPPLWSAKALLDAPDVVRAIHEDYVRAGADIIIANTFRATPRALAKAGRAADAERALERAITLAREAVERASGGREVLIAGAMAPLEDCYRPDLAPDQATAEREHAEQAVRLARLGVDLILIETMNSSAEARAALRGAKPAGIPVLVSFICRNAREVWNGEALADAVRAVEGLKPDAILVNCVGPDVVAGCLEEMARVTRIPIGCYPHAGEPDMEQGDWRFDPSWTPQRFAEAASGWVGRGAQIIGGCCGTGPDHIRALRLALPSVLVE
ncbi:MAG TPA: homocysteine S-methyltransferase family protein [Candidatus Limnocylindrales bacterium]|nr:homocysteine S-methyltransferase family protein [Candidatus Limnocylindrales bacterium]